MTAARKRLEVSAALIENAMRVGMKATTPVHPLPQDGKLVAANYEAHKHAINLTFESNEWLTDDYAWAPAITMAPVTGKERVLYAITPKSTIIIANTPEQLSKAFIAVLSQVETFGNINSEEVYRILNNLSIVWRIEHRAEGDGL